MKKTVKVSEKTWEKLQKRKIELRKGSLNEVIEGLLENG